MNGTGIDVNVNMPNNINGEVNKPSGNKNPINVEDNAVKTAIGGLQILLESFIGNNGKFDTFRQELSKKLEPIEDISNSLGKIEPSIKNISDFLNEDRIKTQMGLFTVSFIDRFIDKFEENISLKTHLENINAALYHDKTLNTSKLKSIRTRANDLIDNSVNDKLEKLLDLLKDNRKKDNKSNKSNDILAVDVVKWSIKKNPFSITRGLGGNNTLDLNLTGNLTQNPIPGLKNFKTSIKEYKRILKALDELKGLQVDYRNIQNKLQPISKIFKSLASITLDFNKISQTSDIKNDITKLNESMDMIFNFLCGNVYMGKRFIFGKRKFIHTQGILEKIDGIVIKDTIENKINAIKRVFKALSYITDSIRDIASDPVSINNGLNNLKNEFKKFDIILINGDGKNKSIFNLLNDIQLETINMAIRRTERLEDLFNAIVKLNIIIGSDLSSMLKSQLGLMLIKREIGTLGSFLFTEDTGMIPLFNKLNLNTLKKDTRLLKELISIFDNLDELNHSIIKVFPTSVLSELFLKSINNELKGFVNDNGIISTLDTLNGNKDILIKSNKNIIYLRKTFGELSLVNGFIIAAGVQSPLAMASILMLKLEISMIRPIINSLALEFTLAKNARMITFSLMQIFSALAIMNTAIVIAGITVIPAIAGMLLILVEIRIMNSLLKNIALLSLTTLPGIVGLRLFLKFIGEIALMNIALIIGGLLAIPAIVGLGIILLEFVVMNLIFNTISAMALTTIPQASVALSSFLILILLSTSILVLGALIGGWLLTKAANIIGFTILLGLFMFSILGIYALVGPATTLAFSQIAGIALIIGLSAALLVLGASIGGWLASKWLNILFFTIALGGFMFTILSIYNIAAPYIVASFSSITGVALIIGLSTALLVLGASIGGWLASKWLNILFFTAALSGFIFLVVGAYNLASTEMNPTTFATAAGLALLTGISAAVLLIGGKLFEDDLNLFENVMMFGLCLTLFMEAMSGILYLINQMSLIGNIKTSLLIMAGITAIIGINALIFKLISDIVNNSDMWAILGAVAMITGVVVAFVGILTFLAGAVSTGIGGVALAGALAIMGGIVAIIGLTALAFKTIAEALDIIYSIEPSDTSIIIKLIDGVMGIIGALAPLMNPIVDLTIMAASVTLSSLSKCISDIAQSVYEYANLQIPIYEGTEIVGYRQLEENDFQNAADNVKLIVETLGNTMIEIYNKNPNLFSTGSSLLDFLGMDTPFSRVCNSVGNLGIVISEIARSVKEYAELSIPIYKGKDIVGYRQLKDNDFKSAGKNVSQIINTLVYGYEGKDGNSTGGIMKIYEEHPELFTNGDTFLDFLRMDTPFTRVCKSIGHLGEVISNISAGVQNYANLKIPTKWNDEGTPIDFRDFKEEEMVKAGENIYDIIKVMLIGGGDNASYQNPTGGILALYYGKNGGGNDLKEIFDAGWAGNLLGIDTPFARVCKSVSGIGEIISTIATGIQGYAAMNFPSKWNEKGEIVEWKPMTENDKIVAAVNIGSIVSFLAKTMLNIYKGKGLGEGGGDNAELAKELFGSASVVGGFFGWNTDTKLGVVINSFKGIGDILSGMVTGIQQMADLKFPYYDPKTHRLVEGKYLELNERVLGPNGRVGKNIKGIFSSFLTPIYSFITDKKNKDFDADDINDIITDVLNPTIETLGKIVGGIKSILDLSFTTYDAEGKEVKTSLTMDDLQEGGSVYKAITSIITVIPNALKNIDNDAFKNIVSNATDIKFAFGKFSEIIKDCKTSFNTVLEFKTALSEKEVEWNVISELVGNMILRPFKTFKYLKNQFSDISNSGTNLQSYKTLMNDYSNMMNTLKNTFSDIDNIKEDFGNNYVNGLYKIGDAIKNFEESKSFNNHVKTTDNYIKTINSLDIRRVDKLIRLTNALNELSASMKGIDNLTEVISNKLAIILSDLTIKITKAEGVIKNSEELGKTRQKLIKQSILEMQNILNHPLTVKVGELKEEDTNSSGGTTFSSEQTGNGNDNFTPSSIDLNDRSNEQQNSNNKIVTKSSNVDLSTIERLLTKIINKL